MSDQEEERFPTYSVPEIRTMARLARGGALVKLAKWGAALLIVWALPAPWWALIPFGAMCGAYLFVIAFASVDLWKHPRGT